MYYLCALLKNRAFTSFNYITKMKKLILLVAIATTISFAACTNKTATEETATETTTEAIEEATEVVEEEAPEALEEVTVD